MKKAILLMAAIVALSATACKKEEQAPKPAIQQTENVQLKTNEAYTFTLPKNKRNDAYEITVNPQHATVSQLGTDANGNPVYKYTPATDYTGSDQAVVANDQELREHAGHPHPRPHLFPGGHHHHHGDCNHSGEEDHYVITFNFTIANSTKATVENH